MLHEIGEHIFHTYIHLLEVLWHQKHAIMPLNRICIDVSHFYLTLQGLEGTGGGAFRGLVRI